MFTGIVQKIGKMARPRRSDGGWRIDVSCPKWDDGDYVLGESIAVQGVCLTVVDSTDRGFFADLLDETMSRTAFPELRDGSEVNLERALKMGDRIGGHIVTGHVDETGRVLAIDRVGRDHVLAVSCSRDFSRQCVMKGSVAINGVSLTIASLGDSSVGVCLIPTTWSETSLHGLSVGDGVNLEADPIGKYVARQLGAATGLTEDRLRMAGFMEDPL